MRRLLALSVVLAGLATPSPAQAPPDPVRVFFGPKAADAGDGLLKNLLAFLDTATVSLHGSVHEVDMILVAEKLAAKAEAGVEVRLVVEGRWWDSPKNKAARQVLERSKVIVTPDTKKSGLMHNKFFVADRRRVWTGSTNLTESCLLYNPNNAVWVESDKVAANFEAEYAEQAAGRFGKKGSGQSNNPFSVVQVDRDTRVATLFSPEDVPVPVIVGCIDKATRSLDLACFVFSSEDIGKAVERAKKRGVKVRVLLDNLFSSPAATAKWKYVPFKELSKLGVPCKYDDEASKLHHKFVVLDDKVVVTGSFNLSANAATGNEENLLVIDSAAVGRKYAAEFERLWDLYSGEPGEVPAAEPGDHDAP